MAKVTGYTGAGGNVVIPPTLNGYAVTELGTMTFFGRSTVTSVTIPTSMVSIDQDSFGGCSALSAINVAAGNQHFTSVDGVLYEGSALSAFPCARGGAFSIPSTVSEIGTSAFYSCYLLSSVTIPASVHIIGDTAFQDCHSLTSISFLGSTAPSSVGQSWILDTAAGLKGHALVGSSFPSPGVAFHGLIMGTQISSVPGIPTGIAAVPGNGNVRVSWTAPDDGGSPIIYYKIYRSNTISGMYEVVGTSAEANYTDSGLVGGQIYWYKVSATNVAGEGGQSSATSVMAPQPVSPSNEGAIMILGGMVCVAILAALIFFLWRRRKNRDVI